MKKLLSILAGVGLSATASTAVVACANQPDKIEKVKLEIVTDKIEIHAGEQVQREIKNFDVIKNLKTELVGIVDKDLVTVEIKDKALFVETKKEIKTSVNGQIILTADNIDQVTIDLSLSKKDEKVRLEMDTSEITIQGSGSSTREITNFDVIKNLKAELKGIVQDLVTVEIKDKALFVETKKEIEAPVNGQIILTADNIDQVTIDLSLSKKDEKVRLDIVTDRIEIHAGEQVQREIKNFDVIKNLKAELKGIAQDLVTVEIKDKALFVETKKEIETSVDGQIILTADNIDRVTIDLSLIKPIEPKNINEFLTENKLKLGEVICKADALSKAQTVIEGIQELKDKVNLDNSIGGKIHVSVKKGERTLTGEADFIYLLKIVIDKLEIKDMRIDESNEITIGNAVSLPNLKVKNSDNTVVSAVLNIKTGKIAIKALKEGKVTITITADNAKPAEVKINVLANDTIKINDPSDIEIIGKNSKQVQITNYLELDTVKVTSLEPSIATVTSPSDNKGWITITGVTAGETAIEITAKYANKIKIKIKVESQLQLMQKINTFTVDNCPEDQILTNFLKLNYGLTKDEVKLQSDSYRPASESSSTLGEAIIESTTPKYLGSVKIWLIPQLVHDDKVEKLLTNIKNEPDFETRKPLWKEYLNYRQTFVGNLVSQTPWNFKSHDFNADGGERIQPSEQFETNFWHTFKSLLSNLTYKDYKNYPVDLDYWMTSESNTIERSEKIDKKVTLSAKSSFKYYWKESSSSPSWIYSSFNFNGVIID